MVNKNIIFILMGIGIGILVMSMLVQMDRMNKEIDTMGTLSSIVPINIQEPELKIPITITVYNPTPEQCDSTPLTTCNGSKIDVQHPQRWCAVSMELYKIYAGNDIIIECDQAPVVNGTWKVMDCSGGGKENVVDLLIANPTVCRLEGCWKGFLIAKDK